MIDKYKKIYIVGGSCSGKSTLLARLGEQGYKIGRSFTTRERRDGEDTLEYYFLDSLNQIDLSQLVYLVRYHKGYYGLTVSEFLRGDVVAASILAMANILAWLTAESIVNSLDLPEILEGSVIYLLDGDTDGSERHQRAVARDGKQEADRRFISESFTHSDAYLEKWFEYAKVVRCAP